MKYSIGFIAKTQINICNQVCYNIIMIKTFKDKSLEICWREGKCGKIKPDLRRRILMKLDSIDATTCLDDLKNPPGNKLHQLSSKLKGFWAISVSGP